MLIRQFLVPKKSFNRTISAMANHYSTWVEAKAKYLEENIETRRGNYFCKNAFVKLEDIPTWADESKEASSSTSVEKNGLQANRDLNSKVSVWQGDITHLEVGAIVNAANSRLAGGGGVDGAIHKAAGPFLLSECKSIKNGCPTGEALLTGGYKLPAKYVIQTVGPMTQDPALLSACYSNSLKLANENNLKSIAFPCISTGVYGYPNRDAADAALSEVRKFLECEVSSLERVIFCVFLDLDLKLYNELLPKYFPSCVDITKVD
ncbi:macro domain-containing protein CT2219-like [Daphnia carinata]|uniref:macro domain-containing protein CT2219-like n=1 Tax=Daphnia carinata TaxID=120202 RepID=UPI00257E9A35|nr:macro domain-containing protein CT2219-like [Daphnia carinata]